MAILKLFVSFLMFMVYFTSMMADMQIHIDSSITYQNSPFYNDINSAGPMFKYVEGGESVAKSNAKSKCCNNHPELGKCIPREDDNPDKDGKCLNYCIVDCERGGVCKLLSDGYHECHCAC
ncbi:hypothetical protein ES332_A02G071300v1 [Gossypium tomentosum]|uniref:Knottin scorpion toxin-like domain-containing protein n=1 Tax=Gossypium tomentosum TaxID=34277 RepID=A0A5D2RG05_GOSTO|nr:hypothetical protein ES332_A02G071300v1 [Gossypium tomentosum]